MSACDTLDSFSNDEDDPDLELGRFEMTVDGDLQETFEGSAVFSTTTEEHPETGEEVTLFGLAFLPDSADQQSTWFSAQVMRTSERPDEGEYAFEAFQDNYLPTSPFEFPDDIWVLGFQTEDTTRAAAMTSDAGTLTITTSSSSRVAGTFSVEASGMYYEYSADDEPQTGSITIEGSFNALGGELPDRN